MQLILQLSRDCNLACRYCYQTHRSGGGMSVETAAAAVRWALDAGHGHVALTWFGGEPLLERGTIEAGTPVIERLSRERGALVTAKISTNGALLDTEFCEFARRHALFVSLSTDGCPQAQDAGRPSKDGTPSSQLVERALEALTTTRTPFATYSVITPENVRWLTRSVDWLFERGSRILISTLDFGADWDAVALRRLEREYCGLGRRYAKWSRRGEEFYLAPFEGKIAARTHAAEFGSHRCAAGLHQVAVDPEGYLYPCIEFLESTEHRIGHVEGGGIDEDALHAWRHRQRGERPEDCAGCGIRERCASTCACLNLRTAGSLRGVDELLCSHERAVTLAADRIGARLWKLKDRTFLRRQYDPHHHVLSAVESLIEEAML